MSQAFNVAVVGVTGVVGETFVDVLQQRQFPVADFFPIASARSVGKTVRFAGKTCQVEDLAEFDFSQVDIAFFSAGGDLSARYAPVAAVAGAVVIDNTSHFRYEPDIPLVVPEINPAALADFRERNIIANPNCSTIQMLVALKPIYDAVGIKQIDVATYQAVSGAGRSAIEELAGQTAALLNGQAIDEKAFERQIAFNVLPQIDAFQDNGFTHEEMKMLWETQKIFGDANILVNATAVRVPVFYGHSEAVHIQTEQPLTAADAKALLKQAPGIYLLDEDKEYPTAITDAADQDPVFVGRVRSQLNNPCGLNLWVVSDNVRKGAALNAVQIAEILIQDYWQ